MNLLVREEEFSSYSSPRMADHKIDVFTDDDAEYDKCQLKIQGMTCAACVSSIKKVAMQIQGTHNRQ